MVETLRVNGAMAPRDHHLIETTRRLLDPGLPEKALPTLTMCAFVRAARAMAFRSRSFAVGASGDPAGFGKV
jgi:hypothetical protein